MIEGVQVKPLKCIPDERGYLYEMLRCDDPDFEKFGEIIGETDKNGVFTFELKLPDYFTGVPLEKGQALVKLEIKIKDTADHLEKSQVKVPVARESIRWSFSRRVRN